MVGYLDLRSDDRVTGTPSGDALEGIEASAARGIRADRRLRRGPAGRPLPPPGRSNFLEQFGFIPVAVVLSDGALGERRRST